MCFTRLHAATVLASPRLWAFAKKSQYLVALIFWGAMVMLAATRASAGVYDVGIIPEAPNRCPSGSDYLTIYMDDEDSNNQSSLSGWVGAFNQHRGSYVAGTELGFCRVDGTKLYNLGHKNLINWGTGNNPNNALVGAYSYSVLKLGTECPNSSKEFMLTIDNEDTNNQNAHTGDISPNVSTRNQKGKTFLYLCMFTPSSGPSMSSFPDFGGVAYGVFAGRTLPPSLPGHTNYWLERGTVISDDEDHNNQNNLNPPGGASTDDLFDFAAGIDNVTNTHFYLAKVHNKVMSCAKQAVWWNGTQAAQFDGAHCLLKFEPAAASLFVYANKYYVVAKPSHDCPLGAYDGANCYVRQMPPGGFVYQNNFYAPAGPGKSCPVGSAWDGANCYFGSAPWGTTAFIYAGNFYTTPKPSCIDGAYDKVSCYVGDVPPNTTGLVYANGFYYAE
ncbi:MAG TPA: hypothetical protein VGU66_21715 [Candidatus Elarobacter sp.]|nr:hypothetical protein [Candidatus Elarobacter sp.]